MEKFIKLAHLEEKDDIIILTFKLPPLLLSWSLLEQEVMRNMKSPGVEVRVVPWVLFPVPDLVRSQEWKLRVTVLL